MDLISTFLIEAAQALFVLLAAPALAGLVRTLKARRLGRRGPSLFQPYRDLLRLFRKRLVLAETASPLFRAAPYGVFAANALAALLVPTFATPLPFGGDLITLAGLLGLGRFLLALAGLDVGTAFGGIGASREVMIAALAEPALLLVVFILASLGGSTDIPALAASLGAGGLRVSLGFALLALAMVALAECGRIPIDNPATHLELTMVHEAMVLEYGGRHLALIEWAAALKLLVYFTLIAALFVPWGLATPPWMAPALLFGAIAVLGKITIGAALFALVETSLAKMRVFRVPDFLAVALMLGALGVLFLFFAQVFASEGL